MTPGSRLPAAAVLAVFMLSVPTSVGGQGLSKLEILREGYPRAFFFRASEGLAAQGRLTFEDWERAFLPLGGIMGKCLDEEVPGRSVHNIDFFTRFKSAHPDKVVLLHFNGNSRDPRFEAERYFAGHWVYHNGCLLMQDLAAGPGESVLHVENAGLFRVNMGRYGDKNEDLGICLLGPDGKPDWSRAEQLELVSIDAAARTLTVRRGAFGTTPMHFPAGESYLAAHATEGPWGKRSNLLWYYNFATTCPRDAEGRTCADVLVADLLRWFGPAGPLAAFDGLEFDVSSFSRMPASLGRRAIDVDADGSADGGYVAGLNVYGIGVFNFHQALRQALGDERIILADGAGSRSQRSFGLLNGIESEGWPILSDYEIVDWSGGLNRHFFWRDNARAPALNYINHKFMEPGNKRHQAPPNIHRLVFAAAHLTDAAITYSLAPRKSPDQVIAIWDELQMGAEQRMHWLGEPAGEPIRLGLATPDLLRGAGVQVTPEFLSAWRSEDAAVSATDDGRAVRIAATPSAEGSMSLLYQGLEAPGGDLLVYLSIRAEPMAGYPRAVPRLVWLGCEGAGQLISPRMPRAGMAVRGGDEQPLDTEVTGATLSYRGLREIGAETHEAYFVHPPWRGQAGTGYTFWERQVRLPEAPCSLELHTGLTQAPSKSDGVVFSVLVMTDGRAEKVFEHWHTSYAWERHTVDLRRWAAQEVTLRFVADAGPADSSVADHAYWGDVFLSSASPFRRSPYTPAKIMTFANQQPFLAGFYFRDAGPAAVNLALDLEGTEPVYLSQFAVHSAPDAMAREFQHGAVLANPSMHDYTFPLADLFPAQSFRRLRGTELQDPETNNGRPVGETLTLGPRDAIFLVRQ